MSNGEKKLVVSLQKISIQSENKDVMDSDMITLSDEEALLDNSIVSSVVSVQPTNSDLMKSK